MFSSSVHPKTQSSILRIQVDLENVSVKLFGLYISPAVHLVTGAATARPSQWTGQEAALPEPDRNTENPCWQPEFP